ncbi:T9SS type A sorting domain-containing protein [Tenacibaculum sp. M341]|uniref:T9SS type A sorting domain-containing protein n=1 Tax=Tenacibaculum sp. M341 TaxID=2530339 RepID=UPI00104A16EC|nr:T9SS type A sorting domain-containing protein [Tenacibaculum sp. M341]TCI84885.1 T9SS type A sorting domain-containing protein [Tenacibaculum sp. M341]
MKNTITLLLLFLSYFSIFSQKDTPLLNSITNATTPPNNFFNFSLLPNGGNWLGSTGNNTSINATTMEWQVTITGVISYAPISVSSNQTDTDLSNLFGFQWEECREYIITLSYIDSNSGNRIHTTKTVTYISSFDPSNSNTITLSNHNNDTVTYNHTKYVPDGKIVTIKNSTIKFKGLNTGIIIEEGGTLILDNSTIEGVCNSPWDGIVVHGNPSIPVNVNTHPYKQGHLIVKKRSIIKNAKRAIQASDGGIVWASNSYFINNEIAVHATTRIDASISFTNCFFETNDDILFGKMKYFAYLNTTRALFRGNKFINKKPLGGNGKDYGVGIVSYYSNLDVYPGPHPLNSSKIPSIFENLYKGIDNYGSNGSSTLLNIKENKFVNVNKCVSSSGSKGDRITLNEFNIIDVVETNGQLISTSPGWGVHTNRCVDHIIDENKFIGNSKNYGIINSQAGNLPPVYQPAPSGKLYLNSFENTLVAIQIQGPNVGTQISCNDFIKDNQYGINIGNYSYAGTIHNGRMGNIGSCSAGNGAGNKFNLDFLYVFGECYDNRGPSFYTHRYINLNGSPSFTYIDTDAISLRNPCTDDPAVTLQSNCNTNITNKCNSLHSNGTSQRENGTSTNKITAFEKALLNNNLKLAESILVQKEESKEIFNAFKGNYLLDLYVAPLSEAKENNESLLTNKKDIVTIYPNPSSSGKFNVSIKNKIMGKNTQISIFDVSGKVLLTKPLNKNNQQINISNFSKGIYFIKVFEGNKVIETKRLIYR